MYSSGIIKSNVAVRGLLEGIVRWLIEVLELFIPSTGGACYQSTIVDEKIVAGARDFELNFADARVGDIEVRCIICRQRGFKEGKMKLGTINIEDRFNLKTCS